MRLSVIIPTLNEAPNLPVVLGTESTLAAMRRHGVEVILVDGGSVDGTPQMAKPFVDRVVTAPRGRAKQMNAGARVATGDVLLFLHADSLLPSDADRAIRDGLQPSRGPGRQWGRFDVRIIGNHPLLNVVAWLMNRRSRLTGIATGDQGIFVKRRVFDALGGYADIPLMEDVELCRRLKAIEPPVCLKTRIHTSGRRWEAHGVWRTIFLMWRIRWRYWRGESPNALHAEYSRSDKRVDR
jgi:rSAM/selenodomain-associated transferase 2